MLRFDRKSEPFAGYRNLIVRFTVCSFLLLSSALQIFAVRTERLINTWKPKHYDIALTLNNQLTEIASARAEIEIEAVKPLSVIDLDFEDLTTDSVCLNGTSIPFTHSQGKLEIRLPETVAEGTRVVVAVTYHGKPKDGLILLSDKDGKPSAVGDNWPDRVHHWIPSFDHPSAKATVSFQITVPGQTIAVANGLLKNVETHSDSTKTWTYNEAVPIPPYCMIISVGDFAKLESTQPSITPLHYYVAQSDRAYAIKGFSPASPALEMFQQMVGPYPYEKLALITGATRFGGMENSSAIVFTQTLFATKPGGKVSVAFGIPENIENVVAHEIAHQWFGDSVTESTWSDLWLSEGFATYFAALFIQKHDGQQAFETYMNTAAEDVFKYEEKSRTPIHDRDTEKLFDLLNPNSYQKGAWVLHMLRSRLGDDAFFRAIKTYYQEHKDSTASTEDLRSVFERVSGQPLRSFFERWIYDSGHPQYELKWSWNRRTKRIRLELIQKQKGNVFLDAVPVTFSTDNSERQILLRPEGRNTVALFRSEEPPRGLRIDSANTLLKEVASIRETMP